MACVSSCRRPVYVSVLLALLFAGCSSMSSEQRSRRLKLQPISTRLKTGLKTQMEQQMRNHSARWPGWQEIISTVQMTQMKPPAFPAGPEQPARQRAAGGLDRPFHRAGQY